MDQAPASIVCTFPAKEGRCGKTIPRHCDSRGCHYYLCGGRVDTANHGVLVAPGWKKGLLGGATFTGWFSIKTFKLHRSKGKEG